MSDYSTIKVLSVSHKSFIVPEPVGLWRRNREVSNHPTKRILSDPGRTPAVPLIQTGGARENDCAVKETSSSTAVRSLTLPMPSSFGLSYSAICKAPKQSTSPPALDP